VRELSLHILDLVENSLGAGARRIEIEIVEDSAKDRLTVFVSDDGRGMDAEALKRATDPFFTTRWTRHVGLGLPLLKAATERCEGTLWIASEPGVRTTVKATFRKSHIDRAPLGNMADTLLAIILYHSEADLVYNHRVDAATFSFDTAEMRELLGGGSLHGAQSLALATGLRYRGTRRAERAFRAAFGASSLDCHHMGEDRCQN